LKQKQGALLGLFGDFDSKRDLTRHSAQASASEISRHGVKVICTGLATIRPVTFELVQYSFRTPTGKDLMQCLCLNACAYLSVSVSQSVCLSVVIPVGILSLSVSIDVLVCLHVCVWMV
jgi:hypothetical protein